MIEVAGDRLGLSIWVGCCEDEAATAIACGSSVVALDEGELGLAEGFSFEGRSQETVVEFAHEAHGGGVVDPSK